jgi:HAD superfamily hydrolase (TIGR01509 family)
METVNNRSRLLAGRCWVFDLDGTLTLPVHDFAMIRSCLEVPDGADILGHLASLPAAESATLYRRLDHIERGLITRTAAAPGAPELVSLLARNGCRLGILTRNTREIALLTLEEIGLASFFTREAVLGRDEARPKPDPDGIHQLALLWRVRPHELVMVGDYLFDLQAGEAAGAATIHVHGSRDLRWPEWTDLCVVTLDELAQLVHASLLPTNRCPDSSP